MKTPGGENGNGSEERNRELLELATRAANVAPWDWNIAASQVYYSAEWQRQLGYRYGEIRPELSEWENRLHPDDRERIMSELGDYLAGAKADFEVEFRLRHKDGSYRWIYSRGRVVRDESGNPARMYGCHVDITERRRLEEQLRQSQKMEGIGQLASGVAHDFNNILAAIMMQAGLACLAGATETVPRSVLEMLDEIKRSAGRAANLTRQLLAFSSHQLIEPRALDLNEIVTSIAKMLQRFLGENVRMQINLHPQPLNIFADAGMIDQTLLNLAINARDAMPNGGRLIIETSERTISEQEALSIPGIGAGRFVCLSVRDDGCGIPPENLTRIFDPFFTTKEPGKGSGLGLATVATIVQRHHGGLKVQSEIGQGSTFEVFLPASDEVTEAALPVDAELKAPGGTETILVVEDEPEVREMTQMVLERYGYKTLGASDAREALRVWAQQDGRVHLIVADLVLPEMNGRDLAGKLRQLDPGLKALFTSGYSVEIAGRENKLLQGDNFLQKPWPMHELLQAVRAALQG